jgi:wyosine [tRNA(Phe)-imidazoG37] synthetase (radical SAM superfamily)
MDGNQLPARSLIQEQLEKSLSGYLKEGQRIDAITFAGNGEPTMHPEFPEIIDDTIRLREKYYPESSIAVLSNATLIQKVKVRDALMKVEYNILKLDSVYEETIRKINCPVGYFSLEKLIENLKLFKQNLTIQTLFVKGTYHGYEFDNSSDKEVNAWLKVLKMLNPKLVMIYTIARDTPINTVFKVNERKLIQIADKVEQLGISVSISS